MAPIIALFGEAEKGDFRTGYFCQNLVDLADKLGHPPYRECQGLELAIQALLYERKVIFFRVHEEGFSMQDYMQGFSILEDKNAIPNLSAICLPGVGNLEIIEATTPVCKTHKSFLILTQKDLYDYLTSRA